MTPWTDHGSRQPDDHQPRTYVTGISNPVPEPGELQVLHSPVREPEPGA
jgi:hypothetical protein